MPDLDGSDLMIRREVGRHKAAVAAPAPMTRVEMDFLVRSFSAAMLAKLYANEHKPGWRADDPRDLIRRLDQEVGELRSEINAAATIERIPDARGRLSKLVDGERRTFRLGNTIALDPTALEAIRAEAADVANFAMMIADRCALLAQQGVLSDD